MNNLTASLQENLLAILCFDEKNFSLVRNAIEPKLFSSSIYRDTTIRVHAFIDQFGKPPKDHLADLVEDILNGKDKPKAELYEQLIRDVHDLAQHLNKEYVLSQLEAFVRKQKFSAGLIKAHQEMDAGRMDEATSTMEEAMRSRLALFHPGSNLTDALNGLRKEDQDAENTVTTGIGELDRRLLGPTRKELLLMMAPPKRGKTWSMVHFGKQALLQRWRVLHVSLEMSERRMGARYLQSLFSLNRREVREQRSAVFELDELGRLLHINVEQITSRPSLADPQTQKDTRKKLNKLRCGGELLIKDFPTGALTIPALKAYLDSIERLHKFTPDLLLLDYADLMKVSAEFHRHDLGNLYKDLRGLAVERNMALVTATQANRSGASSKLVQDTHVSEDWSKIATADCVLTYSQTANERKLGLARLFVANGRNEEDKFAVLLSQNYAVGQFALDSVRMSDDYWRLIEAQAGNGAGEDD